MEKNNGIFIIILFSLLIIFFITFLLSGFLGSADLGFNSVYRVLKYKIFGGAQVSKSLIAIVWNLRIPRAILAIAVGGGLAIAGAGMQAVTQNILAEPYMLGVSSGALVGVTVTYFVFPPTYQTNLIISFMAFCGALFSLIFVYRVSGVNKNASNNTLILAGLAISTVLNAVSNFFIITASDVNAMRNVLSWMMGSLAGARWQTIGIPTIGILILSLYFIFRARDFDLISIGEENALSLGLNVQSLKKQSIVVVSMIAALCVSSGGLIGLVGFIIPHIIRLLFGSEHRRLLPVIFLSGALFLMWMDILSRTLIAPQELPIGIFTALFGGPIFVAVLVRKRTIGNG